MAMFPYSDTNKRYHTYDYALKRKFGGKVVKIGLNGGFTCPNLDGSKGVGGCSYCASGGNEFLSQSTIPLAQQLAQGRVRIVKKWPDAKYIAYFQAHTNTYAPLSKIRRLFEEAITLPDVVGLSVATRADCLSEDILSYLEELSQRTELVIELGLQTIHERTAQRINRCHSYSEFLEGYSALRERGIQVCVHLINGLPGESTEEMLESARTVGQLYPHSMKLHLLHILRGAPIAEEYLRGGFPVLTREQYIALVCDQLENIPAEVILQRLTGDGDAHSLLAPLWSRDKKSVLNGIDKELERRNTCQGIFA